MTANVAPARFGAKQEQEVGQPSLLAKEAALAVQGLPTISEAMRGALEKSLDHVKSDSLPFGLRLLDTPAGRNEASLLINRMYGWRGYGQSHHLNDEPCRVTLAAHDKGELAATLTVGLGSQAPLAAEELFGAEIQQRRDQGAVVCEVVKLACDLRSSKAMLGALFHFAMIHAVEIHGCTECFIEVNPRHRRFYEQMLGFSEMGSPKICPRVNAPAHLLWMDVKEMVRRAEIMGGQGADSSDRSLYPWFFSPREAAGLAQRIKAAERPCACA